MNIAPFLAKACQELDKAMQGTLDGTKMPVLVRLSVVLP